MQRSPKKNSPGGANLANLGTKPPSKGQSSTPAVQKRPRPDGSFEQDWNDEFRDFKHEILKCVESIKTELKSDINARLLKMEKTFEKTSQEIERSIEFLASNYEEISQKISGFEKKFKDQQEHISSLEIKIEDLTRQAQTSYVEIRNVPIPEKESKSDLKCYVINVSKALKVDSLEVRDAFRWGSRKEGKQTVVAELNNSTSRYSLLKAAKAHNINQPHCKLNTSHLGMAANSSPIFISEHLTTKARRLYYLGREMVKATNYKYCWTANGRVYLRKAEGTPAILLKGEEQLESLKSQV